MYKVSLLLYSVYMCSRCICSLFGGNLCPGRKKSQLALKRFKISLKNKTKQSKKTTKNNKKQMTNMLFARAGASLVCLSATQKNVHNKLQVILPIEK